MRILLTAGFDRAPNVLALAELLRRDGHQVVGVLVVSPYNLTRLRRMVRQQGPAVIGRSLRRMVAGRSHKGLTDPIEMFLHGQRIEHRSLRRWCSVNSVSYYMVADLNGPQVVTLVESADADAVIYGGGGILRTPFLEAAGRKVLNAHSGSLPEIRGMNACEWSLLLDIPPAVTIHYIDEGIDTGKIIETIPVPVAPTDTIDQLRARCVVVGVEGLRRVVGKLEAPDLASPQTLSFHRQCFVMAPVLRELLEWKLTHVNRRQKRVA